MEFKKFTTAELIAIDKYIADKTLELLKANGRTIDNTSTATATRDKAAVEARCSVIDLMLDEQKLIKTIMEERV